MPVNVRQIDPQCKTLDHVTLPQLETIIPPHVIQEVLTYCDAWEHREKKLNMQAMVYLIIALALSPQCATREVWRRLQEGLPEPSQPQDACPTAGAFCQRRKQLGVTPMRPWKICLIPMPIAVSFPITPKRNSRAVPSPRPAVFR